MYWIGRGKDLLVRYNYPFLAVSAILTKFLGIRYIDDLVVFSLSLGIFALIVNIGNTLLSKSGDNSARGKKTNYSKGG